MIASFNPQFHCYFREQWMELPVEPKLRSMVNLLAEGQCNETAQKLLTYRICRLFLTHFGDYDVSPVGKMTFSSAAVIQKWPTALINGLTYHYLVVMPLSGANI